MYQRRAFTLIELLIVITIIGILSVALIPKIANAPSRGRDTQRKADLSQIAKALEAYFSDYGAYPIGTPNNRYCVDAISSFSSYFNASDIPNDPSGNSGGVSSSITGCSAAAYASAGEYFYKQLDSGQHYVIGADLENEPASGTQTQNIITSSMASGASSLGDASTGLYAAIQSGEDCAVSGCMFVMAK